MHDRRKALSLAAVLTATVVTGAAAILGLTRPPAQTVQQPALVQAAQPAQQAPQHWEEGD